MPTLKKLPSSSAPDFIPDIQTGATAGPQPTYYAQGTSTPPNNGDVRSVDAPSFIPDFIPDTTSAPSNPAGLTGPLPGQPTAPTPTALQGPRSVLRNFASAGADLALGSGDAGIGALKGLGSDVSNGDAIISRIPYVGPLLTPGVTDQSRATLRKFIIPTDTAQSVGKGIEQAGEFLLPGLGEEAAGAKLTELAPRLGRAAEPLARLAVSTLGSGAVNKLQGGGFGTGALMGGVAGGVGEGAKFIAPKIAEAGLKITKLDRAYKKPGAIGRAILDETTGVTPGTVADSAQARMGELNPQVDAIVDRASVRANPNLELRPIPVQYLRNGQDIDVDATRASLPNVESGYTRLFRSESPTTGFHDVFNADGLKDFGEGRPAGKSYTDDLGSADYYRQSYRPDATTHYLDVPEPFAQAHKFGGDYILDRLPEPPSTVPNRAASLAGPRGVLSNAAGKAAAQGERTTLGQLDPMMNHLNFTVGGEPIPANITPRELLNLERGFGNEFISRWNPETMTGVKGTAANVYHAMGNELDRVVPEAQALRSRISPLITVAKRGKSAELNAPLSQRLAGRLTAHTGALTGAVGGGIYGYEHGGAPAAIRDAAAGFILPELLGSPSWQLGTARVFNSAAPATLGRLVGGGLIQATRKRTK